jgi:5-methyltetrahydrofolate--homocysteine methyltransferase
MMLYGRHLGVKGHLVRQIDKLSQGQERARWEREEPKSYAIWKAVETLKEEHSRDPKHPLLNPRAVFQFFRASATGNRVALFRSDSKEPYSFEFPRQPGADGLCLADYVQQSRSPSSMTEDNVAMFVVTAGEGVREQAEKWKRDGDYLKSHILQALALETAEAYAEWLHSQIRKMWGFADDPNMTMLERFQAKYRGKRYSFGYPACPRLDDQAGVIELLSPKDIGVELTEGFMMEPEASVSAIVFHHPQAQYFSVGTAMETEGGN